MTHHDDESSGPVDRSRTTPPEPHASQSQHDAYRAPAQRPEVKALIEQLTGGDPDADPLGGGSDDALLLPSDASPGGDYTQQVAKAKPGSSRQVTLPAQKVQINRRDSARSCTTMRAQDRGAGVPSLKEDLKLLNVRLADDEVPPSRSEMPTPPSGQRLPGMHSAVSWGQAAVEPPSASPSSPLSAQVSSERAGAEELESSGAASSGRFSLPWKDEVGAAAPSVPGAAPSAPGAAPSVPVGTAPEAHDPYGDHANAEYLASLPDDDDEPHDVATESLMPQSRDSGEWELPITGARSRKWLAIGAAGVVIVAVGGIVWSGTGLSGSSDASKVRPANSAKTIAVPSQVTPRQPSDGELTDTPPGVIPEETPREGAGGSAAEADATPRPAVRPGSGARLPTVKTAPKVPKAPKASPPPPTTEPPAEPSKGNQPFVPGANPNY